MSDGGKRPTQGPDLKEICHATLIVLAVASHACILFGSGVAVYLACEFFIDVLDPTPSVQQQRMEAACKVYVIVWVIRRFRDLSKR